MRDEDDAAYGREADMSSTCPGLVRDKDAAAVELVERHCERLRSTFAPQAGGPSVAGEIRAPSPPSLSQCGAAVSQPCLTLFSRPPLSAASHLNRLKVEVVGRLVEQQDVRRAPGQLGKREARLLAAREELDWVEREVAGEAEAAEILSRLSSPSKTTAMRSQGGDPLPLTHLSGLSLLSVSAADVSSPPAPPRPRHPPA